MGWKYADLPVDQQRKIALPLPTNWTFCGEPGGRIWPVFICPVCGDECDEDWGGCAHFKYVFEPETGRYAWFNGTFFYELAAKLEAMGHGETAAALEDQVNVDKLVWTPDAIGTSGAGGETTFSIKALYPNLVTKEFRGSAGENPWVQVAAFVP